MSLKKLPVLNNERPDLCGPCGGRCCLNGPGIAEPADFGRTPQAIGRAVRQRLRVGTWKVDKFADSLWMRPAHRDDEATPWGRDSPQGTAPCVFLSMTGCRLKFADRPQQCRDVKPKGAGKGCTIGHKAFLRIIRSWKPYKHILGRAARELRAAQRSEEQ